MNVSSYLFWWLRLFEKDKIYANVLNRIMKTVPLVDKKESKKQTLQKSKAGHSRDPSEKTQRTSRSKQASVNPKDVVRVIIVTIVCDEWKTFLQRGRIFFRKAVRYSFGFIFDFVPTHGSSSALREVGIFFEFARGSEEETKQPEITDKKDSISRIRPTQNQADASIRDKDILVAISKKDGNRKRLNELIYRFSAIKVRVSLPKMVQRSSDVATTPQDAMPDLNEVGAMTSREIKMKQKFEKLMTRSRSSENSRRVTKRKLQRRQALQRAKCGLALIRRMREE